MLEISPLKEFDYDRWNILSRGYMAFYKTVRTDTEYQNLWHRISEGNEILAVGARIEGRLVGFSHYMFHPSAWSANVCYLQDLFVDEIRSLHIVALSVTKGRYYEHSVTHNDLHSSGTGQIRPTTLFF